MFNFLVNEKYNLKKYQSLVNEINFCESKIKNLTDEELKDEFQKLEKEYYLSKNISENIIIKSFSLTREAAIRTIGLRPFDQQILGGLILNDGKIAEMKTGEGKTLVATLPATLNAITKKGVHIVTVNDYLAKRDANWMGQVYNHLGLKVGLVQAEMNSKEKKKNYYQDITYITNSELAFDYLRDNQAKNLDDVVQKTFNFCIIDEVDAILIDEARTPLVISGPIAVNSKNYIQAYEIAKYLRKNKDFEIDEKTTNISLTDSGFRQLEKILGIPNIFETNASWLFYITNALRANIFFNKNTDYIVQNGKIVIVDEFTGRLMPDRRWNNGLHEAVEAKEKISIKESSQTIASITYQNFFTLYPKLAGMTGTAKTAAIELESIYNLEVLVIPTAKIFKREDLSDKVYITELAKWKAVANECKKIYETGRPILVGTSSIDKSEIISFLLKNYNIPHNMLNARPENLQYESEIVGQAGCRNSITIATNMAGRGTDIILGGSPSFKINRLIKLFIVEKQVNNLNLKNNNYIIKNLTKNFNNNNYYLDNDIVNKLLDFDLTSNFDLKLIRKVISILYFYLKINYKKQLKKEKEFIQNLGGLYVIGTERHESRRIDNQLRGRAGRQGDPGSSRFFISLEDKIFRVFGGNNITNLVEKFQLSSSDTPLESNLLTKSLDTTQQRVENYYYEIRKNVYDYDEVLTEQRKTFYQYRLGILKTKTIRNWIIELGEYFIYDIVDYLAQKKIKIIKNKQKLNQIKQQLDRLRELLGFSFSFNFTSNEILKFSEITWFEFFVEQFWNYYDIEQAKGIEVFGRQVYTNYEKTALLDGLDVSWSQHLQKMNQIRESISWRAYGQKDPLTEYKQEGFIAFQLIGEEVRQNLIIELIQTKSNLY
jgi:preprotein translocase subunit SecA